MQPWGIDVALTEGRPAWDRDALTALLERESEHMDPRLAMWLTAIAASPDPGQSRLVRHLGRMGVVLREHALPDGSFPGEIEALLAALPLAAPPEPTLVTPTLREVRITLPMLAQAGQGQAGQAGRRQAPATPVRPGRLGGPDPGAALAAARVGRTVGRPLVRQSREICTGAPPPGALAAEPHGRGDTGKGIIVGVIDFGFDLVHPAFRTEDGRASRILALWDQNGNPRAEGDPHHGASQPRSLDLPDSSGTLQQTSMLYGRVHRKERLDGYVRGASDFANGAVHVARTSLAALIVPGRRPLDLMSHLEEVLPGWVLARKALPDGSPAAPSPVVLRDVGRMVGADQVQRFFKGVRAAGHQIRGLPADASEEREQRFAQEVATRVSRQLSDALQRAQDGFRQDYSDIAGSDQRDYLGHGTHIASIAAGSRVAVGARRAGDTPVFVPFAGIAPEADIIAVQLGITESDWHGAGADRGVVVFGGGEGGNSPEGTPSDALTRALIQEDLNRTATRGDEYGDTFQLVDALHFIGGEAIRRWQANPASVTGLVINVSVGTFGGAHDGRSRFERAADALVANWEKWAKTELAKGARPPMLAIVIAAGNGHDAHRRGHIGTVLDAGTPKLEFMWRLPRRMLERIPDDFDSERQALDVDPTPNELEIRFAPAIKDGADPRTALARCQVPDGYPQLRISFRSNPTQVPLPPRSDQRVMLGGRTFRVGMPEFSVNLPGRTNPLRRFAARLADDGSDPGLYDDPARGDAPVIVAVDPAPWLRPEPLAQGVRGTTRVVQDSQLQAPMQANRGPGLVARLFGARMPPELEACERDANNPNSPQRNSLGPDVPFPSQVRPGQLSVVVDGIAVRERAVMAGGGLPGWMLDVPAPALDIIVTIEHLGGNAAMVHAWIEKDTEGDRAHLLPLRPAPGAARLRAQFNLNSIAHGQHTIVVGAHMTNADGTIRPAPFAARGGWAWTGDFVHWSGPLQADTSRQKELMPPHLSAPGVGVCGADGGVSGQFGRMSGSSQAAAHVTGTVALMMQAAAAAGRWLAPERIRELLQQAARANPATVQVARRYAIGGAPLPPGSLVPAQGEEAPPPPQFAVAGADPVPPVGRPGQPQGTPPVFETVPAAARRARRDWWDPQLGAGPLDIARAVTLARGQPAPRPAQRPAQGPAQGPAPRPPARPQ